MSINKVKAQICDHPQSTMNILNLSTILGKHNHWLNFFATKAESFQLSNSGKEIKIRR